MPDRLLESYEEPANHEVVSEIIRRCSTNPTDVRDYVLRGRDLSWAGRILDLGCGFGFMAEKIAPRVHPDAVIWGVDLCQGNRAEFLRRVRRQGRGARFIAMRLRDSLPWETGSFDLIVASYSLYFFPALIPEIARVLDTRGVFLALTHTVESQRDLLRRLGVGEDVSPLVTLVRRFCAENAFDMLASSFDRIERVDYENSLRFSRREVEDLASYLRFKFLLCGTRVPAEMSGDACSEGLSLEDIRRLLADGPLEIRKDDAAFWCWGPRHPGLDRAPLAVMSGARR